MTNAQIWTAFAVMFSLVGLMIAVLRVSLGSFQRAMDARFDAIDSRFDAWIGAVDARFDAIEAKFDARFGYEREYMSLRFDALEHRVEAVESDLSIIKGHLIGQRSA